MQHHQTAACNAVGCRRAGSLGTRCSAVYSLPGMLLMHRFLPPLRSNWLLMYLGDAEVQQLALNMLGWVRSGALMTCLAPRQCSRVSGGGGGGNGGGGGDGHVYFRGAALSPFTLQRHFWRLHSRRRVWPATSAVAHPCFVLPPLRWWWAATCSFGRAASASRATRHARTTPRTTGGWVGGCGWGVSQGVGYRATNGRVNAASRDAWLAGSEQQQGSVRLSRWVGALRLTGTAGEGLAGWLAGWQ